KMKAPPQTIILMSPNHYAVGSQSIQIYEGELTSEYGSLNTDSEVIDIVELLGGTVENNNFYREHGIRVMLPDLRRAFPDVPIVPLMVSDRISQNRIDEFTTQLHSQCDQCLLIASADMSHYQPYELSELHDRLTIRELMERDRSSFTDDKQLAEVGPPHIMSAALLWAELSDHQQFDLFMHTNSVAIDKTYYAEGTTHVMGWYQKGDQQQPENRVSFTLAGDIMFDGAIADNYQDSGFVEAFGLFGDRVLWGTDLVAANLEGPITDKPKLEAAGDAPRFAFNPSAITALHYLHFNALNIQNNHSLDAGEAGLADTKDHLRSAGIEAVDFGNEPFIVEGRGLKLATFFVDVQTDNSAVVESIKRWSADSNIRVLVFAHWGLERQAKHGPIQEAAAHAWIDAGADLVVGTGPHVIQDAEVYQGKPIIYSLGNILFDQVEKPETAQSLILAGEFTQDGLTLLPMLTKQQGLQPVLQRSSEADNEIMERLGELKPFEVDGYGGVRLEFNHIQ
ncbi:MAG: AmmeMemoRadiSam system protein B, partial [Candidatus Saccharimonadales bacterium]|nr:AmmeMemoRadiSam system protein B [Candidatus Saccharimonadales bacterium]